MLCCSTGALMPVSLLLSLKSVTDFWCPAHSWSLLRWSSVMFKVLQRWTMFKAKRTPALSLWVSLLEQESRTRWSPASAILWSCDSPSIYRSSVTEQQLRIGLIMKSLLCLTVKVGLNCKSLLSSNLLWVVLISESSALRIWYCCTYSILSFLMQIKYYNPVLTYCQCCAWYYKLSHLAV